MNKVIIIGNLTRDPELKSTSSGVSVCTFSVAVNRKFTDANGNREADFFTVSTWRGLAENCAKYLSKGRKVAVSGALQNRSYEDKNGNKRTVTEIVADEVEFITPMSNPSDSGQGAAQTPPKKGINDLEPADNEELPF